MQLVTGIAGAGTSSIVDSSSDAIIGLKLNGEISGWNDGASSIFGYSAEEALGKNIDIIIPADILQQEINILKDLASRENTRTYDTARKKKSGEVIPVQVTLSTVMDVKGKVTRISKLVREITTNKSNEEKQSMLASIVDSSDDAIISKTLDGLITSWNSAAQKMFGFSEEEAIGKHISIIIPEDRLEEEAVIIENVRQGKKIDHIETVRCTKNGDRISISLTVSPIKNANGEIIGASKVAKDISDKRTAEEKQAILAAIVNSSDDAIISKTLQGIITSWNHSAEKMFGYSEHEAIGKHISIIIPQERIQEETMIIDSIRSGKKIDHFETVRCRKDGSKINISLTVSPVKNSRGEIIGASKVARDITDKIEAEKKRQLYIEKLQELNVFKDEFMAMASHELKTPLTVISVNLEILKMKMEGDSNLSFIDKTETQVKKFNDLINNLLNVSKINAGRMELDLSHFELNTLVREIAADLQLTTHQHQINFEPDKNICIVEGDYRKICQVMINIITNAIKYSPNGGKIAVKVKRHDGQLLVSCSDNGIGIPEKDLENIFTRFYRVSGIASSFSGSGIGLYISSEIIKEHGGRIWVESTPGKGSTFYFTLIPAKVPQ